MVEQEERRHKAGWGGVRGCAGVAVSKRPKAACETRTLKARKCTGARRASIPARASDHAEVRRFNT
eukprot:scaffold183336_cov31-Tisochrysis_lutea.AAC.2